MPAAVVPAVAFESLAGGYEPFLIPVLVFAAGLLGYGVLYVLSRRRT